MQGLLLGLTFPGQHLPGALGIILPALQGLAHVQQIRRLARRRKKTGGLGAGPVEEEDGFPLVADVNVDVIGLGFHQPQAQQGPDVLRHREADLAVLFGLAHPLSAVPRA